MYISNKNNLINASTNRTKDEFKETLLLSTVNVLLFSLFHLLCFKMSFWNQ